MLSAWFCLLLHNYIYIEGATGEGAIHATMPCSEVVIKSNKAWCKSSEKSLKTDKLVQKHFWKGAKDYLLEILYKARLEAQLEGNWRTLQPTSFLKMQTQQLTGTCGVKHSQRARLRSDREYRPSMIFCSVKTAFK